MCMSGMDTLVKSGSSTQMISVFWAFIPCFYPFLFLSLSFSENKTESHFRVRSTADIVTMFLPSWTFVFLLRTISVCSTFSLSLNLWHVISAAQPPCSSSSCSSSSSPFLLFFLLTALPVRPLTSYDLMLTSGPPPPLLSSYFPVLLPRSNKQRPSPPPPLSIQLCVCTTVCACACCMLCCYGFCLCVCVCVCNFVCARECVPDLGLS